MLTDLLKEQTRAQHEQLERVAPLPASRAGYVTRLAAFFGFVAPWERALAAALPPGDPIRAGRAKTAWLEEDLEFFGIDAAQRTRLPRVAELPSLASRPQILGAAYVLEGSTLGGQIILRHLESTLGLVDGRGCAFFRSYGAQVGTQWQAFRAELLRASSPAHDPVIVAAARDTFTLLHRWFSQPHPGLS